MLVKQNIHKTFQEKRKTIMSFKFAKKLRKKSISSSADKESS